MDGWESERRANENAVGWAPDVRPHVWHATLPPRTFSDHTISMTRWLPRTQVRGLEKLGANAKIDLRPCLWAAARGAARQRCATRGAAVRDARRGGVRCAARRCAGVDGMGLGAGQRREGMQGG